MIFKIFSKLFNWLVNKIPYASAVMIPSLIWGGFVVGLLFFIFVISAADFTVTGTGKIFAAVFWGGVALIFLVTNINVGFFRFLGKKWEGVKAAKILNNNIVKGHISSDISNGALLETFSSLGKISVFLIIQALCSLFVTITLIGIVEYIFSGSVYNVLIIIIAGMSTSIMVIIWSAISYELFTSFCRKECKKLLSVRNIYFKENSWLSLDIKFKFILVIIGSIFLMISLIVSPISLNLFMMLLAGLVVIWALSSSVFDSITIDFKEIEESAKNLKEGKEVISFFGSQDEEVMHLADILNETAASIGSYQSDLRMKYDENKKKKEDLEKFFDMTVGRELKMVELKKKIQELEEGKKHEKK